MGLATIGLLFEYIGMLHQQGLQQWAYQELASVAATKFKFADEEDACDYVTRLAADMQYYAPEHTLLGDFLYESWAPELVPALLLLHQLHCFQGQCHGNSHAATASCDKIGSVHMLLDECYAASIHCCTGNRQR